MPKKFRVDITFRDDGYIEAMILKEWGRLGNESLLCRKRKKGGGYLYTNVTWDANAGQMRAGKWFHRGRTGRAINYVADWRDKRNG